MGSNDLNHIVATWHLNQAATITARVADKDGVVLVQADVSTASYTVFQVAQDGGETAIAAHTDETLTVADLIFDTLQSWDEDETGFNLRHELDVKTLGQAFTQAGVTYKVRFTLVPPAGQDIIVDARGVSIP